MVATIFSFIGFQELVFIIFIAVLIFGPDKIPEIARGLGEGIRAMREATDEIKREVMASAEKVDVTKELRDTSREIQSQIEEAKNTIEENKGPVKRL